MYGVRQTRRVTLQLVEIEVGNEGITNVQYNTANSWVPAVDTGHGLS